jgi:hypothetical protein
MSDSTQGPFSVAETRHKYDIVIRGPKNEPIALVLIAGFSKKEGAANANLLAAAPDLLDALQQYSIGFTDESAARAEFGDYEVDRELKRRAAIARATGEQP